LEAEGHRKRDRIGARSMSEIGEPVRRAQVETASPNAPVRLPGQPDAEWNRQALREVPLVEGRDRRDAARCGRGQPRRHLELGLKHRAAALLRAELPVRRREAS
jgi:hypothetical protein